MATRMVRELYGHSSVTGFGPLALTASQHKFIYQKLARSSVNNRIGPSSKGNIMSKQEVLALREISGEPSPFRSA